MISRFVQYYLRDLRPKLLGAITKLIYSAHNVKFGEHFLTDSIPKILIDKNAKLFIGNNVELRRNVEIRVHGQSEINIENNVRIDRGVRLLSANDAKIRIANNARIGLYTVFNGGDSITLEEKVLVSGFVYLQTSMHAHADKQTAIQDQGYLHKPIVLKTDAWLGTHVVIMPGITVGKGGIVGSNAVVTTDVEDYAVVAGVPAKNIKNR